LASEFHAVPIGLYRKAPNHSHESHSNDRPHSVSENEIPFERHHYVCVNPAPFTKLRSDDRIYILCPFELVIH
jgi:Trk K+ transport system NAD-binding subunit